MTFLHTGLALAGVLSVSIPILIHLLLRQRRKPIRWGAMRFLLEAYRKQRRKLKLQHLLLLLTRCLVVLLLALALGRPLLKQAGLLGGATGTTLYLLVDNSLASSARSIGSGATDQTALDRHKAQVHALLGGLGPGDRAGLIALGSPAAPLVVPASGDLAAVAALVDGLKPTDGSADLRGALDQLAVELGDDEPGDSGRVVVAVLSDFLKGSLDISRPLSPALAQIPGLSVVASRPAAVAPGNVQVISIDPLSPVILTGSGASAEIGGRGQRENVRVKLRRTGPIVAQAGVTTVRLRADAGDTSVERPAVQAMHRWKPGESQGVVTLQIEPTQVDPQRDIGANVLIAEIDRDAVAADNIVRRPIGMRQVLRVGIIGRRSFGSLGRSIDDLAPADWFRLALRPSSAAPIDVIDVDPASIDAPTLASLDAAFVTSPQLVDESDWERLRRFVDAGGLLVVTPAPDVNVHLWTGPFEDAMALGWRLARESAEPDGGLIGLDERPGQSPILSMLRAEVAELSKPVTIWRFLPLEEVSPDTDVLLRLNDGTPWLVAAEPGSETAGTTEGNGADLQQSANRGLVVYMASAPSPTWTNLQATPLMVPLVQELTRQGFGLAAGTWTSLAGRRAQVPARTTRLIPLDADGRELEVSDAQMTAAAVRRAGLWEARDEAGRYRGFVAVNADSQAGRMDVQDAQSVQSWLGSISGASVASTDPNGTSSGPSAITFLDSQSPASVFAAQETDSPLSLPLLIAALVLAIAEVLMARVFSHALVERSGPTMALGRARSSA